MSVTPGEHPARVGSAQGTIHHIGIPIPALRVGEIGSRIGRIRAGEAPEGRAVGARLEVI